jgi:hypothetical protein
VAPLAGTALLTAVALIAGGVLLAGMAPLIGIALPKGVSVLTDAASLAWPTLFVGFMLLTELVLLADTSLFAGAGVDGGLTPRCALAMAITPNTTTATNTEIRITRRFMASFSC